MMPILRRLDFAEFENIIGITTELAHKYLYIETKKRALAYFVIVTALSLYGAYFRLPRNNYFAKRGNVLNEFGVKLGWFWTLFVLIPFACLTMKARKRRISYMVTDLYRFFVATVLWYFCTSWFVIFERMTGRCRGSELSSRTTCHADGGEWIPGFDISGHCYILTYSCLIICEESQALRNISYGYEKGSPIRRTRKYLDEVFMIKINFLLLFILHLIWDFELVVSALYYHHIYHKLVGTVIAIACWFFTYQVWYPVVGIPPPPFSVENVGCVR